MHHAETDQPAPMDTVRNSQLLGFFFYINIIISYIIDATTGNNFTCMCRPGLEGALCDIPFCTVTPCENGGFCLTTDATPVCQCSFGYAGTLCETDINECASTPCQNGGICTDEIGHYRCRCNSTGFEGVNCEIDIDECSLKWNRCGPSGDCINTVGSFKYANSVIRSLVE